jgi:hypothetical protein
MVKTIQPGPPVTGVVFNTTQSNIATCQLTIGPKYHKLILQATITLAALGAGQYSIPALANAMSDISLIANSKVQRICSAVQLDALNALNGNKYAGQVDYYQGGVLIQECATNVTPTTGAGGLAANTATTAVFSIPIFLNEPWMEDAYIGEALALPTAWPNGSQLSNLSLQITCPVQAANYSNLAITVTTVTTNELGTMTTGTSPTPVLNFTKWLRVQQPYAGVGDAINTTLRYQGGSVAYRQISIFSDPANTDAIGYVNLKVNSTYVLQNYYKYTNDAELGWCNLNPAGLSAYRFDLVFDRIKLSDMLFVSTPSFQAQSFEVIPNLTTANAANKNLTYINQVYGPLD